MTQQLPAKSLKRLVGDIGFEPVLSDECEPVSVYHKYREFMQHKAAATRQVQRYVAACNFLYRLGDVLG